MNHLIVTLDVWPYLGTELLSVLCVRHFLSWAMLLHFNHLDIFIVLYFHPYFIVMTFGWLACLCLRALHSGTDLL